MDRIEPVKHPILTGYYSLFEAGVPASVIIEQVQKHHDALVNLNTVPLAEIVEAMDICKEYIAFLKEQKEPL